VALTFEEFIPDAEFVAVISPVAFSVKAVVENIPFPPVPALTFPIILITPVELAPMP
jgi:hypothetical protein